MSEFSAIAGKVIISQDSEAAASFDLWLGPIEEFFTRLDGKLRLLLTDKLAEEPHTDVDKLYTTLLSCFS